MERNKVIEPFLKRFFGQTSNDLYALIDDISVMQKRNKKEVLFLEGEEGSALHFLVAGRVKLYRSNEGGKEAVIRFVQPGEFLPRFSWSCATATPSTPWPWRTAPCC